MSVDVLAEGTLSCVAYSGKFELSGDGVLCIRIDRAEHAPVDAAARSTTVKECWCSCIDGQIPRWEL